MKRDKRENTERIGVIAVGLEIESKLSWIFREQPTSDYGIDAHVEIVDQRRVTGRLIGLQIKSGQSYFDEPVDGGYTFRGETKHLDYWMGHSLPILVVLHNPSTGATHWQVVNQKTVERTEKGWKLTVPTSQMFDESARAVLSRLADMPIEQRRLASLAFAKPWMKALKEDTRLFLKAEEWINKSSGRGSLTLFTRDENGKEETIQEWPFVMYPGQDYSTLLPVLFPWADVTVDAEKYDAYDEQQWHDDCGVWDPEEGRYTLHHDEYKDWRRGRPRIRPYTISAGELALFQLELSLSEIGKAYLSLDEYLTEGIVPSPSTRQREDYD